MEQGPCPWPKRSKVARLPVCQGELGPFQTRSYHQPDLYHEEVVSLDSPFDLVSSSSGAVCVRTVLLLGDQNAGKTTFLHCFADQDDDEFTRLTSQLPILQASFLNSRFLPEGGCAMDELPFLDTDLARSTVLLGMDDWNFVLEERGLPHEASKSAFMCLQLLEVGGDHLDRLMRLDSLSDMRLKKICGQSLALMSCAQKAILQKMGVFLVVMFWLKENEKGGLCFERNLGGQEHLCCSKQIRVFATIESVCGACCVLVSTGGFQPVDSSLVRASHGGDSVLHTFIGREQSKCGRSAFGLMSSHVAFQYGQRRS
jgi:hypothetical protein